MSDLPASFWTGLQETFVGLAEGILDEGEASSNVPLRDMVESPIELLLLTTTVLFFRRMGDPCKVWHQDIDHPRLFGPRAVDIITQMPISGYRVDFVVRSQEYPREVRLAVECDGHDFHERTKKQAARDRSRDRHLTGLGYTVLRYTGSEIHNDPWGCASDLYSHFDGQWVDALYAETLRGER